MKGKRYPTEDTYHSLGMMPKIPFVYYLALWGTLHYHPIAEQEKMTLGGLFWGHTPLREVHYFDLKQSMHNGGGPACLRLRVVLNDTELAALPPGVRLTDENYVALVSWVNQHYREQIAAADLADPLLLDESRRALDKLTQLLGLGSIYPFQL